MAAGKIMELRDIVYVADGSEAASAARGEDNTTGDVRYFRCAQEVECSKCPLGCK